MITFKKPKTGDIVTFHYNSKFPNVEAIYIGVYKFNDGFGNDFQKPIIKLMQDISYSSTHHAGETFKKDSEINFLDPTFKTINGKTYCKTIIDLLKWVLYGYR